jgi:hypothetical protein
VISSQVISIKGQGGDDDGKEKPKLPQDGPAFTRLPSSFSTAERNNSLPFVDHCKRAERPPGSARDFFDKVAKATGVDLGVIEKLHAKEWGTVSRPSSGRRKLLPVWRNSSAAASALLLARSTNTGTDLNIERKPTHIDVPMASCCRSDRRH